jgi:hypothetical protein
LFPGLLLLRVKSANSALKTFSSKQVDKPVGNQMGACKELLHMKKDSNLH